MFAGIKCLKYLVDILTHNKRCTIKSIKWLEYSHDILLIQWLNLRIASFSFTVSSVISIYSPSLLPLSSPFSPPYTDPPRWHDSLSYNKSRLFANAAALCASHSQQALQSCTAGSGYSSKHKHTWITQTGSCREILRVCVCVSWTAVMLVDHWPC